MSRCFANPTELLLSTFLLSIFLDCIKLLQSDHTVLEYLIVVLFVFGAHSFEVFQREDEHLMVISTLHCEYSTKFVFLIGPHFEVRFGDILLLEQVDHGSYYVCYTESSTLTNSNVFSILIFVEDKAETT